DARILGDAGQAISRGYRRVVNRRDGERERVRRRVEIHSAIGGPAIVAHLEREARRSIGVRDRSKRQQPRGNGRSRDFIAGGDRQPVVSQRAKRRRRQSCYLHAHQIVRHRIIWIREAEIRGGERQRGVFGGRERPIGARG